MGSMKLEQHLYFPSGLKISSRTERLHSAWVRSKSGGKILAMRLARHWEDRSLSPASRGWWAGQRQSSLVSKSEALAPVVSASTVLISSSPHASRGHTKPRHPSSPAGEPAVQKLRCGQEVPPSQVHWVSEHQEEIKMSNEVSNELIDHRASNDIVESKDNPR